MEQETITWFAAVDWGSEKHQGCILDSQGDIAGERVFSHSGAGLAELCDWVLSIAGSASVVAIAVEIIAVGMPITGHLPHRTGRAAFPHPAPTLDV